MKAIIRTKYGSPDVLELKEVERPVPNDNQLLVKVLAASVNPLDWHILRGKPFIVRLMGFGFLKPKSQTLGADVAGRIEAVGKNVTKFRVGDEVFGAAFPGSFAEYVCVSESGLVSKPAETTFEQAAAVPVAGITALQGLCINGQIQPGQKVLINGASGGVGTFAVQLAKSFGARVTGVCSTRNIEMVRSIGADRVIDYTKEDYTRSGDRYDLILDCAAFRSIGSSLRNLAASGTYVFIGGSMLRMLEFLFIKPWTKMTGQKKVLSKMAKVNKSTLEELRVLLETGKIVPVIDRRYTFSEVPDALRYLEEGHARGKVVITL